MGSTKFHSPQATEKQRITAAQKEAGESNRAVGIEKNLPVSSGSPATSPEGNCGVSSTTRLDWSGKLEAEAKATVTSTISFSPI